MLGVIALPAWSRPRSGQAAHPTRPGLADLDRDRISDDFAPQLRAKGDGERVEVVVTFAAPSNAAAAQRAVGRFEVIREFTLIRGFAARMTAGQARALARRSEVFRVERNFTVHATLDAATRDFGAVAARETFGVDGTGVGVCVADTGVDGGHEQLDSKTPIPFYDAINGQTVAYDDHFHGTHVASTAVGDGTGSANASTYRGVAPGAALYAAKVLDRQGSGSDEQVLSGIEWCANQSAVRVISMSLGTQEASDGQDSLSQAANNAVLNKGKIVVVAAGNSGDNVRTVGSPGAAAYAITVGSVAEYSAPAGTDRHSQGIFLDFFSSRGPTLDGRIKPDVVAPGDSIRAADANTGNGYATASGTSMATPYVSGSLALAIAKNGSLTPSLGKQYVQETAQDWGPAGIDNDWGAGLIDTRALVGRAAGETTTPTAFPTRDRYDGSVGTNGLWTRTFTLTSADLGIPVAATVLIDGEPVCVWEFWGSCLAYEMSPDLDAQLVDPNGNVLAESICAAGSECGVGRQETLHAMPTVVGTYTVRVYPFSGEPNYGKGGTFGVDVSHGPLVGGTPPPPPPPPPPVPAVHSGDIDGSRALLKGNKWNATFTVLAHNDADAALSGVVVNVTWSGASSGTASCTTKNNGKCSITTPRMSTGTSVTFTLTNMSKSGYVYDASLNHNDDGDGTPTSLTVVR